MSEMACKVLIMNRKSNVVTNSRYGIISGLPFQAKMTEFGLLVFKSRITKSNSYLH